MWVDLGEFGLVGIRNESDKKCCGHEQHSQNI